MSEPECDTTALYLASRLLFAFVSRNWRGWVCWIGSRAAHFHTCVLNSVSLSTYYKRSRETRRQASYKLGLVCRFSLPTTYSRHGQRLVFLNLKTEQLETVGHNSTQREDGTTLKSSWIRRSQLRIIVEANCLFYFPHNTLVCSFLMFR